MTNASLWLTHHRRLSRRHTSSRATLTIGALWSLLMLFAAAPAIAQLPSGDVSAGQRLVQAECSSCHDGEGSASRQRPGPSLRAVAAMPSTTSMSLHAFLLTTHANMPNYHLTPQEIDNVVAYILSLRS
jgi:mono/diheme cytochrome c family protein